MEGIKRLNAELLELNDYNISTIFEYLKTKNDLYEKFNNEEKSLKQMYKYICDKAKALAKGNVAMVNDKVVYIWAMNYFNKSNEELKIKKEERKTPPTADEVIKKIEQKKKETQTKNSQVSMFEEVQK